MRKILLIGKSGQLGSEMIKDAGETGIFGFKIFPFDREELDVTNTLQVEKKIKEMKPDILINTSAYHVVSMCEKNPLLAMAVNFLAVANLAKLCKKNNIIFVTYSTDYVFDGKKGTPYQEYDTPNPLQMYGMSKLAGEYGALHTWPDGVFMIRTCGLYGGKAGSPVKGNFVLNIIKEVRDKQVIEVSSEQVGSPTYAGDLSKATLTLLTSGASPGIYHLVNEGYCSWYEFAQEIFKLAKIDKELKPIDRGGLDREDKELKRPIFSALKNKNGKAIGIELPSWKDGLKSYLDELSSLQK